MDLGGNDLKEKILLLVVFFLIFSFVFGDVPVILDFNINNDADATNSEIMDLLLDANYEMCASDNQMAFTCDESDFGAWVAYAYPYNIDITTRPGCSSSEGIKTIYAKLRCDLNDELVSASASDSIKLDKSPPETACPEHTTITNQDPFTASITCTDKPDGADAGCKSVAYNIDGAGWNYIGTIPASFQLTGDGNHKIEVYGSDALDHNELVHKVWIMIDTNKPYSKIDQNGITQTNQTISFDLNDELSGIDLGTIVVKINGSRSTVFNANNDCVSALDNGNYTCSYSETGLLLQTGTYSIEITEKDRAGNETVQTADFNYQDNAQPETPTAGPGCTTGATNVPLSWNANTDTDIHQYYVYRHTSNTFNADNNKRVMKVLHSGNCNGSCSATDSNNLSMGTAYYYRVSAVDKSGNESALSPVSTACTPEAAEITDIPTISSLTHPEDTWKSNDDPQLTWTSVSGANITYYYKLNQSEGYNPTTSDDVTTGTSKNYTDIDNGTYWFHVRAYNGTNWSSADHYKIKIDDLNPNPPEDFALSLQSEGDIEITWGKPSDNGPSGINMYYIIKADEGETLDKSHYDERIVIEDEDDESYVDADVSVGNTYCYRMYSVDFAGNESGLTDKLCKKSKKEGVNISISVPEYVKAEKVEIGISSSGGNMKGCILKLKKATDDHFRSIGSYFNNTSSITRYYTFSGEDHGIAELKVECDNGEKTKTIRVDTGIPIISWIKPSDGETIKGKVELQVEARDIGYGLKEVVFYYNGTQISKTTSAFEDNKYRVFWDAKDVSPAEYTLKAKAIDKAGNSKEAEISVSIEKEEEPAENKADEAINLAEESKAEAQKIIDAFNKNNLLLPDSLGSLKKKADSLLISSKSYFSKDDFENAEKNAKKAMEKYESIASGYSIEEFFKKEISFKEEEIDALIESVVLDKEIADEAIANLKEANAKKEIRVFKVKEADEEKYVVAIEVSFENKSGDTILQIVEFVPKELAKSSDEISSVLPFEVLVSDPVIKFTLQDIELGDRASVTYFLKNALSKKEFDDLNEAGAFTKCNTLPLVFKSTTLLETAAFTRETEEQIQPAGFFSLGDLLPWIGIAIVAIIIVFVLYLSLAGRPPSEPESKTPLRQAIDRMHGLKKPDFLKRFSEGKKEPIQRRWKYEGA